MNICSFVGSGSGRGSESGTSKFPGMAERAWSGVSRSARLRIAHDRVRRVSGGPDPSRSVTDTRETNGSLRIASCGQPVFADPNHRTAPTLRYEVNCRRPIAHARGNRSDKITGVIQARSCARQMHAESDNIFFLPPRVRLLRCISYRLVMKKAESA